jgi:hypothetical protein
MCRERWIMASAMLLAVGTRTTPAAAQACCAGGALVNPARLALHEDYAVGLQTRVRQDLGSFDPDGRYHSSANEQDFEQDLAASFRLGERSQAGVVLPLVETRRLLSGIPTWGSGVGDLAIGGRYDPLLATEALYWPGIGILVNVVLPTGKAVGEGTNPASTDATGTGTYNATLGIDLEKVHGPLYLALNAWVTYVWSRTVLLPGSPPLTTDFPLQWTLLGAIGYVFESEAALGGYVSFLERGDDTLNGVRQPGTVLRLTTVGVSGVVPLRDVWRVQASIFSDVLVSSFGSNELAGAGASLSVLRVWW